MNNIELKRKVRKAAGQILAKKGFISVVDILMEMGILSKEDYENWRFGKVPYLERVCRTNLNKLLLAIEEVRVYANEKKLKPSYTAYVKWGKGEKVKLRFSKSGKPEVEKLYSIHYILNKVEKKQIENKK